MSRLAKKPINIPDGVTFKQVDGKYIVTGSKGTLEKLALPKVIVEEKQGCLNLSIVNPDKSDEKAYLGTAVRVIGNMIIGVTEGFTKKLEINGVGFKAEMKGKDMLFNVGFSHPVEFFAPEGIFLGVEKNVISVTGIDKEIVGQAAANIRKIRKPEPYKGKGIKYDNEVVRRKEGKQAKSE